MHNGYIQTGLAKMKVNQQISRILFFDFFDIKYAQLNMIEWILMAFGNTEYAVA